MVGGLFFATLTMVVYLVRQLMGEPVDLQRVAVGIVLAFFVSYTGTGFFVWYILHVAESELDQLPRKTVTGTTEKTTPASTAPDEQAPAVQEAPEVEENP